jgi:hypothetical protein
MFDEGNVEGIENTVRRTIPEAVRLGMRRVPDEDTGNGSMVDLGIISGYESVGMTANFTKM